MTVQPIQKPMRQRTNLLYVLLLLGILAATAYPEFRGRATAGSIMFKEVKRSIGGWEQAKVPAGWEVKAAFYRPLTQYEIGLPGVQAYVLVLQRK